MVARSSLERRPERDEERRSELYGWRIVPISPAVLPLIDSDGPRMPPPSRKSTFHARCFLTDQRGWRREQQFADPDRYTPAAQFGVVPLVGVFAVGCAVDDVLDSRFLRLRMFCQELGSISQMPTQGSSSRHPWIDSPVGMPLPGMPEGGGNGAGLVLFSTRAHKRVTPRPTYREPAPTANPSCHSLARDLGLVSARPATGTTDRCRRVALAPSGGRA
jgi:hypothetical protein